MIPVLSANQIRETDAYTIENEPIPSIDLMERASRAFVAKFMKLAPHGKQIVIFAGIGNNGGDALAIARLVHDAGYRAIAYTVGKREKGSEDFKTNLNRLTKIMEIGEITEEKHIPAISSDSIIIEGIFGSGLSRPVEGIFGSVIEEMNQSEVEIFAIDIPSGLYADEAAPDGAIVKASYTLSFQVPKRCFFQPSLASYVGEWYVLNIGLNQSFISSLEVDHYFTEEEDIKLPARARFDHKGTAGRLLLISGSKGKMGATTLSAQAAMRSGCGLLFIHTPSCGANVLQVNVPEAMVIEDEHSEVISEINPEDNIDVLAIGPGIGTSQFTTKAMTDLIQKARSPLVLDADAINILAQNSNLLNALPPDSILTPHPGEFQRLVGEWKDDFERLTKLKAFCKQYALNVVLKGALSAVCNAEGKVYFNSTGNPGMATGGSGDVLTGMVASFLTQGMEPFEALRSAVYVHGLAGDLAKTEVGEISMIASDIIRHIPRALMSLRKVH